MSDHPANRPSLTRRHAILATGGFLALAACGWGGEASATLKVGNQRGTTKALMLAAGVLDGAPYRVEWSEFPAAQSLLEALGSGAVDLGLVGDAPFERGPVRLTVDGYQIRIDDRIVKTDFLGTAANGGSAIKAILVANGVTGVDSAQFFTNAIDTRTRGVDVVGEYTLHTAGAGTVRLKAAWSYFDTKILNVIANPAQLSSLKVILFGRQVQQDLLVAVPKSKAVLSANWSLGRFSALVRETRYGAYTESSTTAASDRTFGAKWVADLELGYRLSDKVNWSVGANNLFDTYPDRNGIVAFDGSGAYGSFAPFGLYGGFYYTRVGVTF